MLEAGAVACHEKTGSGKEVYQAICAAYAKR
jgi:hypothetical protein